MCQNGHRTLSSLSNNPGAANADDSADNQFKPVELTERQLNIPKAYARKFAKGDESLIEELESIGNLALIKATHSYDADKGKLDTYLIDRVRYAMLSHVSLNGHTQEQRWEKLESIDPKENPIPDRVSSDCSFEDAEFIEQALKKLSPTVRAAFVLRHTQDKTYEEIGELIGVSETSARNYANEALCTLNRYARRVTEGKLRKGKHYGSPPPVSDKQKRAVAKANRERFRLRRVLGNLPRGAGVRYIVNDETKSIVGPDKSIKRLIVEVGMIPPAERCSGKQGKAKLLDVIVQKDWRLINGTEANLLIADGYKLVSEYRPVDKRFRNKGTTSMARIPLPDRRKNWTVKVSIDGQTFYLTCGEYDNGKLGEIFINANKTGTFIQGVLDGFARHVSRSLQWGMPLEEIIQSFQLLNFPPNGQVIGSDVVKNATSVYDWVAQELTAVYCSGQKVPKSPHFEEPDKSFGYISEPWRSGA